MTRPRGPQQVFDRVASHLLEQGKKAMAPSCACRYRINDGGVMLKCAVGCLIPDDIYDPDIEGSGVGEIIDDELPVSDYLKNLGVPVKFLESLQGIHDAFIPDKWPGLLKEFARVWGLEYRGHGSG